MGTGGEPEPEPESVELDVCGMVCPQPVAVVRRALDALDTGELVVVGDYPPAARSIRRSCYRHGYDVQTVEEGDQFELRIRA